MSSYLLFFLRSDSLLHPTSLSRSLSMKKRTRLQKERRLHLQLFKRLPFGAAQAAPTEEMWHVKVGQHRPQTRIWHCVQVMPEWEMQRRLLKTEGGEVTSFRVLVAVTPRAVLTSTPTTALLRSKLPLHRHICSQLRHKHTGREDASSSSVLKSESNPVRILRDPGQPPLLQDYDTQHQLTFCCSVSLRLCSVSQTLTLLPALNMLRIM